MIVDGVYVTSRRFTIHINAATEGEIEEINEGNPEYAFEDIPVIPFTDLNKPHEFYTAGSPDDLWKVYLDGRELKYPDEYTFEAADEAEIAWLLDLLARLMTGGGTRITLGAQTMASLQPGQHIISADFKTTREDGSVAKETVAKTFNVTAPPSSGGGGGGGSSRSRSVSRSYDVTVTTPSHGSLSVNSLKAESGARMTVTAKPDAGYQLKNILVRTSDSKTVTVNGTGTTRTFTMPDKAVTVSAEFQKISYQIHTTTPLNGTFSVSHTQAASGTTVTITTRPAQNYIVDSIRVSGTNVPGDVAVSGSDNRYTFKMPGKQVTVAVTFRLFRIAGFTDIDGNHTFFTDISWAYHNGLMNGMSEKYFEPDGLISYATVVVTIARLAKVDLSGYVGMTGESLGIPDDAWYLKEALWARDIGLFTSGENLDGLFTSGVRVNRSAIPRGTFAIMLRNYLNFNGIDTEVPVEERVGFADADRMSSVEEDHAFQALYKANIFRGGTGDEQFRMYPTANTTRGNLAALLRRVSDYIREYRIERERNEAESQS